MFQTTNQLFFNRTECKPSVPLYSVVNSDESRGDFFGVPTIFFSMIHPNYSQWFIATTIGNRPSKCAPRDSCVISPTNRAKISMKNTKYLKPLNQSVVSNTQINSN